MANRLVSFRDFLTSGHLGAITPDLVMQDVARLLGPPDFWQAEKDTAVPLYWAYSKLEMAFAADHPYPMQWLQIEHAGSLAGDVEVLHHGLVLPLDGLNGNTRPSEFVKWGLWDLGAIDILYCQEGDDIDLHLRVGRTELVFVGRGDFEGPVGAPSEINRPGFFQCIDNSAKVDSVYAYAQHCLISDLPPSHWKHVSAHDYLTLASA